MIFKVGDEVRIKNLDTIRKDFRNKRATILDVVGEIYPKKYSVRVEGVAGIFYASENTLELENPIAEYRAKTPELKKFL